MLNTLVGCTTIISYSLKNMKNLLINLNNFIDNGLSDYSLINFENFVSQNDTILSNISQYDVDSIINYEKNTQIWNMIIKF